MAAAQWDPRGFDDFRRFYPATPPIARRATADATAEFIATWDAGDPLPPARDVAAVLVRGLFGRWIPRHFAAPLHAMRNARLHTLVARTDAAGTVDANAARLTADVARRVPADRRIVFLCHSKGGLDALEALRRSPELRRRTAALVLCQTPRSGCAVMESVLLGMHASSLASRATRLEQQIAALAIAALGARAGALEVTSARLTARVGVLETVAASVPMLAVASWSSEPSAWLDSQHGRLGAIRPDCAHDGLFWLEDLVWPVGEQVLLPRIDHSQPCVGGLGFAHERLWLALAGMALARVG